MNKINTNFYKILTKKLIIKIETYFIAEQIRCRKLYYKGFPDIDSSLDLKIWNHYQKKNYMTYVTQIDEILKLKLK